MEILTLLHRNIKWRFHNTFTIIITLLQPMLWLLLYSVIASHSMKGLGISNYTAFILPGLMVLVCFGACSSSGIMNYLMKTDGSFYRVLIAPVKRQSIVLGQILEAVVCSFIEVTIMCLVSLFFSVKLGTGLAGFICITVILFLTAFSISGLTYAISLSLPNQVIYETVMNAIVLPIFFLSTALFPADGLTGAFKIAVTLNPFTHVINVLRELIFSETIPYHLLLQVVLLLLLMCGVSFSWAWHMLKKETHL